MSSRPYSFLKAFGLIAGQLQPEQAKVEAEMGQKLKDYHSGFNGYQKALPRSLMVPLASDFIAGDEKLANEVREVTRSQVAVDPSEVAYLRRKMAEAGLTKALSWLDESVGGALVAPPAMGELIEVLRNNEVLMAAGARVLPMPPQGRITYPRQTSAMSAFHVGESQNSTDSTPGTGDVVLTAKKLTILAKIPNELFHFSAVPIEGFIREDMAKVMGLKMDKTLLEDVGSQTTPKGLINYSGINSHTALGTAADANSGFKVHPNDPAQMIAETEEQNATFRAFIMRPLLWATLVNRRADSVTAGDGAGPYLFNVWREYGEALDVARLRVGNLNGYPVYKSTQISKTRTRGTGTTQNTYVLAGDFSDYLIAMGGAIEFAISTQGDTPFVADQTWFKGVTYYDGAPRHEASFTLLDNVLQNS